MYITMATVFWVQRVVAMVMYYITVKSSLTVPDI